MNRLLLLLIALGMLCGASSCKTWRRLTGKQKPVVALDSAIVVRTDSSDAAVVVAPPATDSEGQAQLQKWLPLWNAQTTYSTFSAKAKMAYEGGGESEEFSATIRMERGKRIWISITGLLGIEGARALITPDTIIAIDRIHKEVRILPFAEADKLLPVRVDFATLQSLIIGDVLRGEHQPEQMDDSGTYVSLRVVNEGANFFQEVKFDKSNSGLFYQMVNSARNVVLMSYGDFRSVAGRRFAFQRNIDLTADSPGSTANQGPPTKHHISLDFTKATFDEPVDMSFSIPSKYERK